MSNRFLRMNEVRHRVGLSRRTILDLVDRAEFPQPVRPSKGITAWPDTEIDGWMEAKMAEREGQPA